MFSVFMYFSPRNICSLVICVWPVEVRCPTVALQTGPLTEPGARAAARASVTNLPTLSHSLHRDTGLHVPRLALDVSAGTGTQVLVPGQQVLLSAEPSSQHHSSVMYNKHVLSRYLLNIELCAQFWGLCPGHPNSINLHQNISKSYSGDILKEIVNLFLWLCFSVGWQGSLRFNKGERRGLL